MLNKNVERNKPVRLKSFLKRLKHYVVSKLKYSTKKDLNKKYKWKKLSNNIKKKILKAESKMYKKVPYLLILWTDNNKKIQRFWPIWLNKKEKKRQVNGQYLLKKSSQWQKQKCSRSLDQVKERENVGKEELIWSLSSVKISPANHPNSKDSFDQWVYVSNRLTWLIHNLRLHSN